MTEKQRVVGDANPYNANIKQMVLVGAIHESTETQAKQWHICMEQIKRRRTQNQNLGITKIISYETQ
ncbi:hypothetical protein [Chakrabartyella piscis]|uniref:hypothetical protein n=1 Tax=Chakrabartyella piscis TaxID=2918914 RepID=UPI0029588AF6|nr:hypothetical protein [Chakrabartyella piscis]